MFEGFHKRIETEVNQLEKIDEEIKVENLKKIEKFLENFSIFLENEVKIGGFYLLEDLKNEGWLGSGGAGSVFSLVDNVCFKNMKNRSTDDNFNFYDREAEISKKVSGLKTEAVRTPYFYAYYRTEHFRNILMEEIRGVNLEMVINGYEKLPIKFQEIYFENGKFDPIKFEDDLLVFLEEMRKLGISHNDLEARNVMVDENGKLVVIDFGRSEFNSDNVEDEDKVEELSDKLEKFFIEKSASKKEIFFNKDIIQNTEEEKIVVKREIFDKRWIELAKEKITENKNNNLWVVKNNLIASKNRSDLILGLKPFEVDGEIYFLGFKNED